MTRGTTIRRLLAAVAVALVLVLGVAAIVPVVVSTNVARDRIALELADWLGGTVAIAAPPRLEYAPEPRLLLPNVTLRSGDDRWTISSADISAHFDLSALVRGEMEFSAFTIEHPDILIAVPDATRTAWIEAIPTFAAELGRLFRQRLAVTGGTLGDLEHPEVPLARDLSLKFSADADGRDAVLKGTFIAADHTFNLRLMLADVGILDGNTGGAVGLVLASPLFSVRADGSIPDPARDRMMGTVELATRDLRGLLNRLGAEFESGAALGRSRIAGTGHFGLTSVAFDQATIELDGNIGDGQLALGLRNDRPVLEGTLAFDALDLTPYAEDLRSARWSDTGRPIWLTTMLRASDVDLRLSAARVTVGDLGLKQASAAVLLKDDGFTLDIGQTAFRGGQIGGNLRLSQPGNHGERDLGLALRGTDIDIAGLEWPDMGLHPVSGRASLEASARATGRSLTNLLHSVTGRLTLTITDGIVAGGDLDRTVARQISLPQQQAGEQEGAGGNTAALQTRFDTLQLEASIDTETVKIERLALETTGNAVVASGLLTRGDGQLSLRGRVESGGGTPAGSAAAASSRTGAKVLPFLIRGDWRKPQVLPNLTAMTPQD